MDDRVSFSLFVSPHRSNHKLWKQLKCPQLNCTSENKLLFASEKYGWAKKKWSHLRLNYRTKRTFNDKTIKGIFGFDCTWNVIIWIRLFNWLLNWNAHNLRGFAILFLPVVWFYVSCINVFVRMKCKTKVQLMHFGLNWTGPKCTQKQIKAYAFYK